MCNHDCFNCIYEDCICDDAPRINEISRDEARSYQVLKHREWYRSHPEASREHHKKYYESHKAECNAKAKSYYQLHKAELNERRRINAQKQRDRLKEQAMLLHGVSKKGDELDAIEVFGNK